MTVAMIIERTTNGQRFRTVRQYERRSILASPARALSLSSSSAVGLTGSHYSTPKQRARPLAGRSHREFSWRDGRLALRADSLDHGSDDVLHLVFGGPAQPVTRLGGRADAAPEVRGTKQSRVLIDVITCLEAHG